MTNETLSKKAFDRTLSPIPSTPARNTMAIDTQTNAFNDLMLNYAESLGFGEIHFKLDVSTGLRAIVAIHSTKRGPALGGCRCIEYTSVSEAIRDALRLARGMSYKAAISNLPLGGGKAVLMRPKHITNREAYFEAFGKFVNDLGGRYITAVDSGTNVSDMDVIARQTSFVTTHSLPDGSVVDPSPFTALGVRRGIEAAVKFRMGKNDLEGIRVAVQGVGHVGYYLSKELHALGAKLVVCDVNAASAQRCADEFGAEVVESELIYGVTCDVYAPCALGATLNDQTIPLIKAKIIAGAANNQLAEQRHGHLLQTRNVLYAPDYVINAGGLIHAVSQYEHSSEEQAISKIHHLYDTLITIFEQAHHENLPTSDVADSIAAARL